MSKVSNQIQEVQHASTSNPNNEGPGFLTTEGCNQNFIPLHAPHFGGLWEAAVNYIKYHLRRTLGALPNDPHHSYLSPGHFLIGEPLTQLPTIDYSNIKLSRLSRWQTFQQQLQNFWKRWSADYLHELQHRQRWHRSSHNIQPGAPVILREDNTAPLHWTTAFIINVHPGADGNMSGHSQEHQRDS